MTTTTALRLLMLLSLIFSLITASGFYVLTLKTQYIPCWYVYCFFYIFAICLILAGVVIIINDTHILYGWQYAKRYLLLRHRLQQGLIEAGFCQELANGLVRIPKIEIWLSQDLGSGHIAIQNSIALDNKLSEADISAALGDYVVDVQYLDTDKNNYLYEFYDSTRWNQEEIKSKRILADITNQAGQYKIFLQKNITVRLQSMLIAGQTGSGKTYALYYIVLQAIYKDAVKYHLYFSDLKASSLYVMGTALELEHNASSIEETVDALHSFVDAMKERESVIADLLNKKLDATYEDFGLDPYVFIFDEYAAFTLMAQRLPKSERDEINSMISQIVLMGRQLGFFLVLAMQKSDATTIPTSLRDNLPIKIVLGNSDENTYITAFGVGYGNLSDDHYETGEGMLTEPKIAPEPRRVYMPKLDFDILEAVHDIEKEEL